MLHEVQVPQEHYDFDKYDDLQRWASYWYQIRAALARKPKRVLEIGLGTGVFRSYLRNAGVEALALDIDESRSPDLVGDITDLDGTLPDGERFDIIAAFQVLEHIPFEHFDACLEGFAKRADYALISLPCLGWQFRWSFGLGSIRKAIGVYLPYPYRRPFNKQHHWELSRRYSVKKITRAMNKYFVVEEKFRIRENPYHYFWALRSRTAGGAMGEET